MKGFGAILCSVATIWSQVPATKAQSSLGTENQTSFPHFLGSGGSGNIKTLVASTPWGSATVNNANPYTHQASGTVRTYDFTIARGTFNVDGTSRSVVLVNGQFPGPTIEANWGDTVQVTVHNKMTGPEEGTAIHWHGILQTGSPWEDGTPGIGQCPIAPGQTHTYSFVADLYGSSFYHSHYSAQYSGGLFGAIVVYGPWSQNYDEDKGPVLLSDWGHQTYEDQVLQAVGPGNGLVFTDSSLINGKVDAKYHFTSGNTYRLRLVNAASEAPYTFSIDQHDMTVIAHDFVAVQPYTAKYIALGAGQRVDVLVNATGDAGKAYYMRSAPSDCSLLKTKTPAKATIFYQNTTTSTVPSSTPQAYDTGCAYNELSDFGAPAFPLDPPSSPSTTVVMNIENWVNSSGNPVWGINRSVFHANYDQPPLLLAHNGKLTTPYDPSWNIYNFGSNSSVRIVIYNYNDRTSHPMHLHGHNFFVVAQGYGIWDGKVQASGNPPRRDTLMVNAAQSSSQPGYSVIEYNQDNPGVWLFHCHISWHISAGLGASFVERPADIVKATIPAKIEAGCLEFQAWQAGGRKVNEIDSGLKRKGIPGRMARRSRVR